MRPLVKCSIILMSLLLICGIAIIGGNIMPNDFIESIKLGVTTYDEVLSADPAAKAVVTSYGYITFHELTDGSKVSIKFIHDGDDFIARSINITID